MEHFLTVAQQVLILFALIGVGFVLGKRGIMNDKGAKVCADIALMIATPCVIINSFRREATAEVVWSLLAALGASVLVHAVGIGVGHLLFGGKSSEQRVMRLATVLSNAGFMALPLLQAVLGDTGVFYGAAYVAVFNVVLWSYGELTVGTGGGLSWRKMLLNPGSIGLLVGIAVMLIPVDLPTVVATPLSHLAALNTPLPMLFIGYNLSKTKLSAVLRRPGYYLVCAARLLIVPVVAGALLYLLGMRGTLYTSMMICVSAPVAASLAMFAGRCGQGGDTAVDLVALSTVISLITMPVLVALVQMLPA